MLLDYNLLGRNGLELLEEFQSMHLTPKTILLTGTEDESLAAKARKFGADFMTKPPDLALLKDRVKSLSSERCYSKDQ